MIKQIKYKVKDKKALSNEQKILLIIVAKINEIIYKIK